MSFIMKHATQDCPHSCFAVSLGIIMGIAPEEARSRYHEQYYHGTASIRSVLTDAGLSYTAFMSDERNSIETPGIYLCSVPSLNIVGGSHYIVIEVNSMEDWQVLDPVKGRVDRKYYIADIPDKVVEPLAVMMGGGYNLEASFKPEDVLEWRERNGVK